MRNLPDFDEDRSLTLGDKRLVFDSFSKDVKLEFECESRRLLGEDVSDITAATDDLRNQLLDLRQRQRDTVNDHGIANHTSVGAFGNDDDDDKDFALLVRRHRPRQIICNRQLFLRSLSSKLLST